jgi:hypothetical protein
MKPSSKPIKYWRIKLKKKINFNERTKKIIIKIIRVKKNQIIRDYIENKYIFKNNNQKNEFDINTK